MTDSVWHTVLYDFDGHVTETYKTTTLHAALDLVREFTMTSGDVYGITMDLVEVKS